MTVHVKVLDWDSKVDWLPGGSGAGRDSLADSEARMGSRGTLRSVACPPAPCQCRAALKSRRSPESASGKTTPWASQDDPGYPGIENVDWDSPGEVGIRCLDLHIPGYIGIRWPDLHNPG